MKCPVCNVEYEVLRNDALEQCFVCGYNIYEDMKPPRPRIEDFIEKMISTGGYRRINAKLVKRFILLESRKTHACHIKKWGKVPWLIGRSLEHLASEGRLVLLQENYSVSHRNVYVVAAVKSAVTT